MSLRQGDWVGDYEVLSVVGHGATGSVYRVRNRHTPARIDALKALHAHHLDDDEYLRRFAREMEVLSELHHPNIAQLRTVVSDAQGRPHLVMELVEGQSLHALLARGPLPLEQAVSYAMSILDALDHAHRRGVIHRDLKPDNIRVSPAGVLKLVDFGLAQDPDATRLTMGNVIIGTPRYLSPEQLAGNVPDARSDLYAAGVTLYEMVTGRSPFGERGGSTSAEAIAATLHASPTPPCEVLPSIPAALNEVILKALRKNPDERFRSAEEFQRALQASIAVPETIRMTAGVVPPPIPATSSGPVTPPPELPRPSGAWAAGPAPTAAAASAAAAASTVTNAIRTSSRPRPKRRAWMWILGGLVLWSFVNGRDESNDNDRDTPATQEERAVDGAEAPPPAANAPLRMEFVVIEPGEFLAGCSDGDSACAADEMPRRQVSIERAFEIGAYEVTQAQWQAVMRRNPSVFKGNTRPVDSVRWADIQDFFNRVNSRQDGYRYRLPTEEEWEYAARAGTTTPYAGDIEAMAWYDTRETRPVGRKQPNRWGLYDMHGNVAEWVQRGVLRGGDYQSPARALRSSARQTALNDEAEAGFRVVRERDDRGGN